jgi:hypothetical protein
VQKTLEGKPSKPPALPKIRCASALPNHRYETNKKHGLGNEEQPQEQPQKLGTRSCRQFEILKLPVGETEWAPGGVALLFHRNTFLLAE